MYLTILKKDLKRKKTMNCIILLFVILSAMFFSSSVNNIVSIATGLDNYLDKAGMADYLVLAAEPADSEPVADSLKTCSAVNGWRKEECVAVLADNILTNGEKMKGFSSAALVLAPDENTFKYFDSDNNVITTVNGNDVYITNSIAVKAGLKTGDTICLELGDTKLDLTFAGICKDAALGSDMLDNPRFLISNENYDKMMKDTQVHFYRHALYYISTDDNSAVEDIVSSIEGVRFSASRDLIKMSYVVNMLIAGVVMAVSISLIIIAFVVLRFTISFSIAEEFREIGVMKAVGLKNRSIRLLYLVKYLGLAATGAALGFAASFPFGDMLINSVSKNMIINNDHKLLINIICSIAVIGVILLFCWSCTGRIKKLSPIDAVRSGQTGERFTKHGSMALSKSRLGANSFLSLNDVFSAPKQTAVVTAVFTLCALLVMILSNTASTLASDKLIYLLDIRKSDAYLVYNLYTNEIITGNKTIAEVNEEVCRKLAENGMDTKVHTEGNIPALVTFDGKKATVTFTWCPDTVSTDYYFNEGTAPKYKNEIALCYPSAEKLGCTIGDTVEVNVDGQTSKYIVTALYNSFNSLGACGRFHETAKFNDTSIGTLMAFQIDFDDAPDNAELHSRIERIKDIFGTTTVFDSAGYVNDCTKAADAVMDVKFLTLIVALVIILLITVLIERSFISKEKAEIALMKAMGFKGRSVINIHVLRFVIIAAISIIIAAALSIPATKVTMDPIFGMMGASKGVDYSTNITETFVIFPLVIMAAVSAGAFITALYTLTVKASDTADIE